LQIIANCPPPTEQTELNHELTHVQKTAELTGHGNPIFTLELSQKPGILFTGGNDKGLVEWSLE
jgi:hypothetical protein